MSFDFAFFLVLGTALSGLIWLLDAVAFAPRRRQGTAGDEAVREPVVVEYARSFFPVLLAVLVLRSFIAEPFRIPSGSMMPTLLVGDFILVNKFTYGVRLPVLNTKVLDTGSPQRGDVAVFRFPRDPSLDYIKRIVGLPGDVVAYYNKTLYVNGERAPLTRVGPYDGAGAALCKTIKENPATIAVPVWLYSSVSEDHLAQLVQECGADDYVRKGAHLNLIVERIAAFIARGSAAP